MRKYVVELIGTFFLVLTVGCVAVGAWPGVIAPLAIGSVLMVMVFAGAHISGGHYNPAITLGVWIRGGMPNRDVIPYMAAQIIGAFLAAFAVFFLLSGTPATTVTLQPGPAWLAEFLFTFALVYVVLNVATSRDTSGNSYYGLAIGFTVLAGAFAVGPISSAAFNPAVAIGLCTMGVIPWSDFWIYLVANFAGGALAGVTYNYLNRERLWPVRKTAAPPA